MMRWLLRPATKLLLLLYLLGGHAAAHGLSWCLDADEGAHLELSLGPCGDRVVSSRAAVVGVCATEASGEACRAGSSGAAECRHLPLTTPHRNVFGQSQLPDNGAAPLAPAATVFVTAVPDNPGVLPCSRLRAAQLPLSQTLTAQRYIVLTC